MTPRFSDTMILRPAEDAGVFHGDLGEDWTIGPKIHGGVMVALCAKAAREAYGPGAKAAREAYGPGAKAAREAYNAGPTGDPAVYAVAVSANFLSAPDPGPVRLVTTVRKRGRRIGLVDVELVQGDRACVHAVVTLGVPEHDLPSLYLDERGAVAMPPEPPPDVAELGPGHSGAVVNHLSRGCDIRPLLTTPAGPGQAPEIRIWVRPRLGAVDELFALMCGDISLPVPYLFGRRGWAPTVQLTAYLRRLPVDGWLRVLCTADNVGSEWFDEDHTVVDSTGRIVVQTRQLALVAAG